MKVLVTGGRGYLGCWVVPKLLAAGHQVRVLDRDYFGTPLSQAVLSKIELVRDDIREVCGSRVLLDHLADDCGAIIHLAAVSNDPSAELDPELTWEVNLHPTVVLAEKAKRLDVPFIFSSTCAIYGAGDADRLLDEGSPVEPLTVYSQSKYEAEQALLELATPNWSPLILRNGTLFGYSPRMRFDLVVNIFAMHAQLRREVKVFGAGRQYRPHLHVRDCAAAMVYFLDRSRWPASLVNVGHENKTVLELAETVRELYDNVRVVHTEGRDDDRRNYRVDNSLLLSSGFRPGFTVQMGIAEVVEAIAGNVIPDPEALYYQNVKWMGRLMQQDGMLLGAGNGRANVFH